LSRGGLREQQRRYHREPKTFVHGITLASSQVATGLAEFQNRRLRTQGMVLDLSSRLVQERVINNARPKDRLCD
jgi:hypothetical protein